VVVKVPFCLHFTMSRRPIALLLLSVATLCSCLPLAAQEVQTAPPAEAATTAQESAGESQSTDCHPPYTAVSCTAENTKFAGWFDLTCLIGIPALFLLLWPALRVRNARKSWRMTSPLYRWAVPAVIGAALVALAVLFVPFFPQMAPVRPENGLLKYMGIDPAFIESCDPCRTRVTNRAPFFGLLPSGMPPQGLAPQHPYALGAAIVFAFLFWGGLHWALILLWRRRGGIGASGAGGGA